MEDYFLRRELIYVPLSLEAEKNNENDCTYRETHESEYYSELILGDETDFHFEIYNVFNQKLDLLIDHCEEEKIPFEKLEPARRIAEFIMRQQSDEEKRGWAKHLVDIIQKAIDSKTCVWIEG